MNNNTHHFFLTRRFLTAVYQNCIYVTYKTEEYFSSYQTQKNETTLFIHMNTLHAIVYTYTDYLIATIICGN